ncbi:DUF1798 family protein [Peribacillus cavernae]|uniref:DUF1798 family protein n=1 Tax=Peribacillus cavernae TaxID=1674310 RepID=A0A433HM91_9BACI|nr:YppE family protein [Peribacillus cavernae]MDQ0218946.1 hypothetical protein [Peribacillus cavernae]RUQ29345.1 DUF1798 family protein [Peribacillus cavernae]
MRDKEVILKLTKELIGFCQRADQIYEDVRSTGKEKDFYNDVKPFADKVQLASLEWADSMKVWMREERFQHLFPQQIDQTVQNLSDVAVQAFFPKTSYKRFKSHVQSVQFILQSALHEINKKVNHG